ncbi:phage tail protein [Adhaeribacter rhizoryzae]|uniref:Phage tail protein n=1 Tax=Adhaeribacter rhizoryzae TaxID=2607907 RepID=A0A5M6DLM6_9BACT|nr:phage tail protein [Adhaeribacter rhizoryzae]KAA5548447.1 phage tail protein [Adhaeribacter rhizoryzae]
MAEYPLPKFHFEIEWGGTKIGFTEVTGLDKQVEVIEYREGQSRSYSKTKQPGLQKYSNITMKRGTFEGKTDYYDWLKEVDMLGNTKRRDITIKLLNENHAPVFTWKALNAFPVKVQASDLKADGNEVAIETIEIAHEGLSLVK